MKLAAILWDYDGTLVNSAPKNLAVTKSVLSRVRAEYGVEHWPEALTSVEKYNRALHDCVNWRQLYANHLGLTEEEITGSQGHWSECQAATDVTVELFPGLEEVVQAFPAVPHGICSQNCSQNIRLYLEAKNLANYFQAIIGYQDIAEIPPKPHPDRFLYCLQQLGVVSGVVAYIGDHQEDMLFVRDTREQLKREGRKGLEIIGIAACYGGAVPEHWTVKPDFEAHDIGDVVGLLHSVAQ